ncbi:MAG: hypothetical protein GY795_46470 [Desulfobacterales bacterium]|nr:hypothetical protein [Desulfobacterales bacterium]
MISESEIRQRQEFLFRFSVNSEQETSISNIPHILKICSLIAFDIALNQSDCRRLSFVFPKSFDSALWIAVCSALALIKNDFPSAIERLPDFYKGQKLLLNNTYVVEYDKKDSDYIWIKQGSNAKRIIELNQILRLQPVKTNLPLAILPRQPIRCSPPNLIDIILDIKSFGNKSIFANMVIIVSPVGKTFEFIKNVSIHGDDLKPILLSRLFQWGKIASEGDIEIRHNQQVEAEPVIAVSNLFGVNEYLQSYPQSKPLIIFDGNSSFINYPDVFDDILKSDCPTIAVMEQGDDGIGFLAERSFHTWVWSNDEIKHIDTEYKKNSIFKPLQRSLSNYAEQRIETISCNNDLIEEIAGKLEVFHFTLISENPEIKAMEGSLYGCLLPLARLVRSTVYENIEWYKKIEKRFQKIESEIRNNIWLSQEDYMLIDGIISDLKKFLLADSTGKTEVIRKLILSDESENLAVIVENVEERNIAEEYWKKHLDHIDNVHFCGPNTINTDINVEHMVICGWFKSDKMRFLFDSCLAPKISVLTYPFEKKWFDSLKRKRMNKSFHRINRIEQSQKAKILKTDSYSLLEDNCNYEHEQKAEDKDFDIDEFELRLRDYRRNKLLNEVSPGESTFEAFLTEFSEDRFAFLTESFKIPVVNDFFTGKASEKDEVPRKNASELKTGDYVIFKEGAQSDLIREIADMGLNNAGLGHLRKKANLWKRSIIEFEKKYLEVLAKHSPNKFNELKRGGAWFIVAERLKEKGCIRHPQTIKNWLKNDDVIGPRNDRDLDIIAETVADLTGDTTLESQLEVVRTAIQKVRGAHLQASHFLAEKLVASLPAHLNSMASQSMTVEIEGIGKAVAAQVEYISKEPVKTTISRINRILTEED